jgi:hypothetical protein
MSETGMLYDLGSRGLGDVCFLTGVNGVAGVGAIGSKAHLGSCLNWLVQLWMGGGVGLRGLGDVCLLMGVDGV